VGRSLQLDIKRNGQALNIAIQPEPIPSRLSQSSEP
jgi:hypothetical protein